MRDFGIAVVRLYQLLLSPLLPASCRFYPTCSEYTIQALRRYGFLNGSWLGFLRIIKCHPFHPGGYDPIKQFKKNIENGY